jgi:3-isopropylmalate/(R)-2-methylmalate dehydratase large subunit
MGKTIVEKILGRAGGNRDVSAGDIVNADIDFVMTNDAVGELTVEAFERFGQEVWNREKVAVVLDHYIPATTENAARVHHLLRRFARSRGVHLLDHEGVCHQLMVEEYAAPGAVIIGTDSHTCTYGGLGAFATGVGSTDGAAAMATGKIWLRVPETIRVELTGRLRGHVHGKDIILKVIGELGADGATYKALEFGGTGARALSSDSRLSICNMAIEAGAKTGIFEPDDVTRRFMTGRRREGRYYASDVDASYCRVLEIDLDHLVPQIAYPWSVDNVVSVDRATGTPIDQAFVGACTNGRLEDLKVAATVLKNHKVHPGVRFLIAPASRRVYQAAASEGFIDVFLSAGAVVCNPGCSACFGGQGMLWEGETCIGSHNRNFRARMGHKDSRVFLASTETVAVSAVAGTIADPREFETGRQGGGKI